MRVASTTKLLPNVATPLAKLPGEIFLSREKIDCLGLTISSIICCPVLPDGPFLASLISIIF